MSTSRLLKRLGFLAGCLSVGLALNSASAPGWGATVVGFDSIAPGPAGTLYSINAQTGAVVATGPGAGIALSSGPVAGTILYSSPVNVYELNVASGTRKLYACTTGLCGAEGDHAFDSSTGTLYALGRLYPLGAGYPDPISVLLRLTDSGIPYPGVPESTQIGYSVIGYLGLNGITTITGDASVRISRDVDLRRWRRCLHCADSE